MEIILIIFDLLKFVYFRNCSCSFILKKLSLLETAFGQIWLFSCLSLATLWQDHKLWMSLSSPRSLVLSEANGGWNRWLTISDHFYHFQLIVVKLCYTSVIQLSFKLIVFYFQFKRFFEKLIKFVLQRYFCCLHFVT